MNNIPSLKLFCTGTTSNTSLFSSCFFLSSSHLHGSFPPSCAGSPQLLPRPTNTEVSPFDFTSFQVLEALCHIYTLNHSAPCSAAQPGTSVWGFAPPPLQQHVPAPCRGLHRQPGRSWAGRICWFCWRTSLQESSFLLRPLGGGIVAAFMSWQSDGVCRSCSGCPGNRTSSPRQGLKLIRPVRELDLLYGTAQRCCFCFQY